MSKLPIPMSSPDLTADDIAAVNAVLQTPILSIGPQTIVPVLGGIEAFEQAAAEAVGVKFGVGVNSGTAGLHLGVIAADVQPGDLAGLEEAAEAVRGRI